MAKSAAVMGLRMWMGVAVAVLCIAASAAPVHAQESAGKRELSAIVKKLTATKRYNVFLNLLKGDKAFRDNLELSLSYVTFTMMIPTDTAFKKAAFSKLTSKQKKQCIQFSTIRGLYTLPQMRSFKPGYKTFTTHPLQSSQLVKVSSGSTVTWKPLGAKSASKYATITWANVYVSKRVIVYGLNNVLVPPKFDY